MASATFKYMYICSEVKISHDGEARVLIFNFGTYMYSNDAMDIIHHMFCRIANCDNKIRVRITVAAGVAVCAPLFTMQRPQNNTVKWNTA